jgi:hypothetical protein
MLIRLRAEESFNAEEAFSLKILIESRVSTEYIK